MTVMIHNSSLYSVLCRYSIKSVWIMIIIVSKVIVFKIINWLLANNFSDSLSGKSDLNFHRLPVYCSFQGSNLFISFHIQSLLTNYLVAIPNIAQEWLQAHSRCYHLVLKLWILRKYVNQKVAFNLLCFSAPNLAPTIYFKLRENIYVDLKPKINNNFI